MVSLGRGGCCRQLPKPHTPQRRKRQLPTSSRASRLTRGLRCSACRSPRPTGVPQHSPSSAFRDPGPCEPSLRRRSRRRGEQEPGHAASGAESPSPSAPQRQPPKVSPPPPGRRSQAAADLIRGATRRRRRGGARRSPQGEAPVGHHPDRGRCATEEDMTFTLELDVAINDFPSIEESWAQSSSSPSEQPSSLRGEAFCRRVVRQQSTTSSSREDLS
jgi:hypothetical protein